MEINSTIGAASEGFQPIEPGGKEEKRTSPSDFLGSGDKYGFQHLPALFDSLEKHFPFIAMITGIIGYVVISAYGQMNNSGEYLGYVFFVFGSFIFYKYSDSGHRLNGWEYLFICLFLITGFAMFLIWLSIVYLEPIKNWMVYLGSFFG